MLSMGVPRNPKRCTHVRYFGVSGAKKSSGAMAHVGDEAKKAKIFITTFSNYITNYKKVSDKADSTRVR
jgi:hypothetical protein